MPVNFPTCLKASIERRPWQIWTFASQAIPVVPELQRERIPIGRQTTHLELFGKCCVPAAGKKRPWRPQIEETLSTWYLCVAKHLRGCRSSPEEESKICCKNTLLKGGISSWALELDAHEIANLKKQRKHHLLDRPAPPAIIHISA